jgi:uncharacterized protein
VFFPLVATVAAVVVWSLVALAVLGALCVAYGVLIEHHWYRIQRYQLPVLPSDASGPVRILHLSDLHFVRDDDRKARFLASLPEADFTILTGDLLGEPEAVERAVAAVRPTMGRAASLFVFGSNDLYVPKRVNPVRYFLPRRHRAATRGRPKDLSAALDADGWRVLLNERTELSLDGVRFEVVGFHDPHIYRADLRLAPRTTPSAVGLAVVHSPDPAPELAAMGYDLVVTGHTHGGQVRLPLIGALVTNSHLPRRICMGLSRLGPSFMHVSPGLGTSKFAPFRFLCRPEATYLDLVPASS